MLKVSLKTEEDLLVEVFISNSIPVLTISNKTIKEGFFINGAKNLTVLRDALNSVLSKDNS